MVSSDLMNGAAQIMGLNLPVGFGSLGFSPPPAPVESVRSRVETLSAAANSALSEPRFTPIEENLLRLLSDGHSASVVASTLGISESAVSQHLSKDEFREELARRKTVSLEKFKKLDNLYDEVELALLEKLNSSLFMFSRPGEITAALSKINAMKRRLGVSESGQAVPVTQVVQITLPTTIVHRLTTTQQNHIVAIGDKSLVTIPSHTLARLANPSKTTEALENRNAPSQDV